MVSMQAQKANNTRNRSTMYSRFLHISITPLHQGVANRLFMQQRPSEIIIPSMPRLVKLRARQGPFLYVMVPWKSVQNLSEI